MKKVRLLIAVLTLLGLSSALTANAQQRWVGHTPSDVYAGKYTVGGEEKTSEAAKILYLYNVGTGQYLAKGDAWGTRAICSKQGLPITLVEYTAGSVYYLETPVMCENYHRGNGYIEYMDGTSATSTAETNVLCVDQGRSKDGGGRQTARMTFTPVTVDGYSNLYRITLTADNTGAESDFKGTFYLCGQANGIVMPTKDIASLSDHSDKWILVTQQDFLNEFATAEASEAQPAPAYFLLKDYDFARNDNNISTWYKDGEVGTSDYELVNNTPTPTTPGAAKGATTSVTTPAKYTYSVTCTYYTSKNNKRNTLTHTCTIETERSIDGLENVNDQKTITSNFLECDMYGGHMYVNDYGIKQQAITLKGITPEKTETVTTDGYTYYVGNGYGETKTSEDEEGNTYENQEYWQRLYGGKWTANIHGAEGSISQKVAVTLRSGWYEVSCDGFSTDGTGSLFASVNGANANISDSRQVASFSTITDVPATYVKASNKLSEMDNARQSVTVYVPRKSGSTDHTPADGSYIVFGAFVENENADSWTCIDNFNLRYLGDPDPEYDILIDEDQTDYNYINGQVDATNNHTLRLKRSFKVDKWNSLILPVDLTASQVTTAFGGDTKLSELDGTESNGKRINFKKVDLTSEDAIAIKAGQLYIIKPQTPMPTGLDTKTRTVSNGSYTGTVTLDSYYTINQVVLKNTITDGYVSGKFAESTEDNGIQYMGTYVKKGEKTTDNTDVIKNPAIPANSYILSNGLWLYSTTAVNQVKGLRGWLTTNAAPASAKDMIFVINGVEEGVVTGIEGVENTVVNKVANGHVFNLNGQLVRANANSLEGLEKGVYIVNGKKVVVK